MPPFLTEYEKIQRAGQQAREREQVRAARIDNRSDRERRNDLLMDWAIGGGCIFVGIVGAFAGLCR